MQFEKLQVQRVVVVVGKDTKNDVPEDTNDKGCTPHFNTKIILCIWWQVVSLYFSRSNSKTLCKTQHKNNLCKNKWRSSYKMEEQKRWLDCPLVAVCKLSKIPTFVTHSTFFLLEWERDSDGGVGTRKPTTNSFHFNLFNEPWLLFNYKWRWTVDRQKYRCFLRNMKGLCPTSGWWTTSGEGECGETEATRKEAFQSKTG